MPDIGSGLSGFGQQIGDMLGGLLGTSQDALSDLPEADDLSELDGPDDLDDLDEDDPEDVDEDADEEPEDDENDGNETDTEDDGTEASPPTVCEPAPDEPPAIRRTGRTRCRGFGPDSNTCAAARPATGASIRCEYAV